MSLPKVYSDFDPPPKGGLECKDASLTRQSEAGSCDINKIVAQFDKTGFLPEAVREGLFLDVSEMGDYREALEQVRRTNEYFMSLPAAVRGHFANDPAQFLDFVSAPENRDKMIELGLLPKEEAVPPAAGTKEPARTPPATG